MPGAFVAILLQPLSFRQWDLVGIRCVFISFSMIVMGFLVVFEWDALFPDRRDYQILTPLPIGLFRLFLTKGAAFAVFLGLFLLDINFFSTLLWAGVDNGKGVLSIIGAHLAIMVLSGLFAALSMAAVPGVLQSRFLHPPPSGAFPVCHVRPALMAITGAAAVSSRRWLAMALTRPCWSRERRGSPTLSPAIGSPGCTTVSVPASEKVPSASCNSEIGHCGEWPPQPDCSSSPICPGIAVTLAKSWKRRQPRPRGPGRLRRAAAAWIDVYILRRPAQVAVLHFINQTITRSMKHRLFLAAYAGCGGALAILTFLSGRDGLLGAPPDTLLHPDLGTARGLQFPLRAGRQFGPSR